MNAPDFLIANKETEFVCATDEGNPSVDLAWNVLSQNNEDYLEVGSKPLLKMY